jgi:hypothetical protein
VSIEITTELLPCPLCGGMAVMRKDDDPRYPWYVTFEHDADCMLYAIPTDLFRSFATEAEAIAAWNTRHEAMHRARPKVDAPQEEEVREVIEALQADLERANASGPGLIAAVYRSDVRKAAALLARLSTRSLASQGE